MIAEFTNIATDRPFAMNIFVSVIVEYLQYLYNLIQTINIFYKNNPIKINFYNKIIFNN